MTDGYLKLRRLSDFLKIPVPKFETARFALRAEARASEKKKRARALRARSHRASRACARAIVALTLPINCKL